MLHLEPPSYQPIAMAAVARQVKAALVELKQLEESQVFSPGVDPQPRLSTWPSPRQVIQGEIGLDIEEDDAVTRAAREKVLYVLGQQPGEVLVLTPTHGALIYD